jgi:hypothetical protein
MGDAYYVLGLPRIDAAASERLGIRVYTAPGMIDAVPKRFVHFEPTAFRVRDLPAFRVPLVYDSRYVVDRGGAA